MSLAIIFDFDGTLVDSERIHFEAMNDVLRRSELGFTWERYIAEYVAFDDRGVFEAVHREAGRALGKEAFDALEADKETCFWERVRREGVPVFAEAVELLRRCAAWGVPLGVCTGSSRADVEGIWAMMGDLPPVAVMVTADDVEVSKPDPSGYRLTVEGLQRAFPDGGIRPESCIAVEDTLGGLEAARGAGCRTLAVTTTLAAKALNGAADRVVEDPTRLTLADLQDLIVN